ncbi:unnamed protein product [Cylicocyclus nassatus]|uniref:Uncharacterized protein n=1 Tax=Cylicocyclus nassatus TaxID=53992 RepID=A0AA36H988_CYLNA|nr:unnamed protein product [Cylicocyclus nassatus]
MKAGKQHPRRPRLSPEPSTSSEPAASLPSFAEGAADEETEPSQVVDEEMAEPNHAAGSETVELGQGAVGNVNSSQAFEVVEKAIIVFAGHSATDGDRTCYTLSLLINVHRRLHESYFYSGTRSEATDFPMFKSNVESPDEFSRHIMSLQLTIATDGFVPARLSRQELWPLYVRVDDLPSKIGNNYLNIIMAGVLWTSKTPHEELWEGLWTHLATELALVNSEPLQILDNGLKDIFGIPRWLSRYGCHKCLFPGNSVGRKLNWYCSEPLRFTKRTSANILEDAELGRNGLMRKTSAMDLFTPAQCCADALHVISEGVTQDRLRDLLFRSSKVDEMKLRPEIVGELNRVLMNITNYTYSSRFILCNEDLPSMTGAEVDAFANVVFPLVGALALCPSALSSASIVGYWFCVKELQAVEDLTTVKIRVTQSVALHLKQIWSRLSQEIFTIKTHNFFDHCILDEIEQHGSPYLWSAAPFEAIHRVLQIPHNQYVTNSGARVLTRFVTIKKLVTLMEEAVERNHSENFAKLLRDVRNEKKRFPLQVQLGAGYYVPQHSEVKEDSLCEEHRAIFQRHHRGLSDVKLYSRLVVSGKVLSSKAYWRRTTDTDASSFYLRVSSGHSTLISYGKLLLSAFTVVKNTGINMHEKQIERSSNELSESSELGLERVYEVLEPVGLVHGDTAQLQEIPERTILNQNGWRDAPGVEVTEAGSLPHHYTHTLPSDALEAVRACLLREVGTTDFASSLYAIVARGASLSQVSLQETLHQCTRHIQRFDMEDIYKLVQSAERSRLGTLYDVIETTRLVVENALSTRIQENLLLAKIKELEGQVNSLKQMCKRNGAATHETSETIFAYENLKGHHVIKYGSPFKEAVLNDILRAYAPTNRVKHKTCLVITEFLRTVFKQICAPDPSDIWNYAHRTSNISRKQDLIDLPESLIITLTDFVLDALDLGWRDLQGHRLNALRSSRDSWWLSLGETDDERDKKFNSLLEKKSYWSTQTGLCISEAL